MVMEMDEMLDIKFTFRMMAYSTSTIEVGGNVCHNI